MMKITASNNKKPSSSSSLMSSASLPLLIIIVAGIFFVWSLLLPPVAMAQQQQTTTTTGTGAATTTTPLPTTTPLTPLTPALTPQEQNQQIRLQNIIASTTLNLDETEKQIGGVVFTPRWSNPVWVNANSIAVLVAYCLPGEFADSGQEILGGFGLEVLESYGVALPQGFMAWMAVVGNEDIQNRRFPAALGVICASDLNKPETRVLSLQKQQEINNINEQFVNIQNTQITDIDNVINVINTVTTTTTTTTSAITPPPGQNTTGTGAGTALLPASRDTTPPTLIVPEDMVVEATSEQGAQVFYTVTAQDNVDGTFTLEEDGSITRDNGTDYANIAGIIQDIEQIGPSQIDDRIVVECSQILEPSARSPALSGSIFPIGDTTVECTATDSAGNSGFASFLIKVIRKLIPSTVDEQPLEEAPVIEDEEPTSPPAPHEIPLEMPPVIIDEEPSSPSPQEPPAEDEGTELAESGDGGGGGTELAESGDGGDETSDD